MTQKDLIISLLQQDLKHSQLVMGLDRLGLEASERHCLQLLDIIANLMQVPEGHVEFDWGKLYITYMAESVEFEIDCTTDSLKAYAETCYDELLGVLKRENDR